MEIENYNNGSLRPETAQQMLKKSGMEVTLEEAKNILDFMYFLTNLSVARIVDQDKNRGL